MYIVTVLVKAATQ